MNYKSISKLSQHLFWSIALIALPLLLFGCSSGSDGTNGTSLGTVTGAVTDTLNNKVANATVTPSPAVDSLPGGRVSTATDGTFTMTVPNGTYTLTFAKTGYTSQTLTVSVVATQTKANTNVVLVPTAAAAVTVTGAATFPAAGSVTLTATPVPLDPALVGKPATFQWKDQRGNVLGTAASVTVNRPTSAEFKANVAGMVAPLSSIDPAPVTVDANGEESVHKDIRSFSTLDRTMVVGIPMKAYEDAANPTYTVAVTISGQTFSQTVAVGAGTSGLPFVANPGLRNVPVGQPLMLQGRDNGGAQTTWNWTITPPTGSTVTALIDPTTRFPHFTPDVVGTYTVTETVAAQSLQIYAGQWIGLLKPAADGSDNPRGDIDPGCLNAGLCHSAATLAKFTDWKNSGHSEVMVVGMSEGSHYSLGTCAKCHSVGGTYLGADASAGSFRDVAAAAGYTNATFLSKLIPSLDPAVIQKSKFFQGFPQVLQLSEIQCENCHGPNSNGDVHGPAKPNPADAKAARVSFSSDVCAPCHGEPLRHGRFQEWRESGHGNFETAIHEGITGVATATPFGTGPNTSCAGCHTGQAFPAWLAQLQGGNPLRSLTAANTTALAGLRTNNVQPQTCATCHTPHDVGKLPGLVGNIIVLRGDYQSGGLFAGNTPLLPSGFQANGVGKGALCITCHNSRNGGLGNPDPNATTGNRILPVTASLHEDNDVNFGVPYTGAYPTPAAAATSTFALFINGVNAPGDAPDAANYGSPLYMATANTPATSTRSAFNSYSSPHEAAQGDALMGRNAYFFGSGQIGQRSKHSLLADACVTCHLEKTPADPAAGVGQTSDGAGTNHSFGIVTNAALTAEAQINALCAKCHGSFDGTGVQKTYASAYDTLLTELAIRAYLLKTGQTPAQAGLTIDTDIARTPVVGDLKVTFIPGRSPQIIVNGTVNNLGRPSASVNATTGALTVTVPGWLATVASVANPFTAGRFTAQYTGVATAAASGAVPAGTVLNSQGMDAILARANWNACLVSLDASKGVHNPSFTLDVINATINGLKQIR
jgi:hypothetical protein